MRGASMSGTFTKFMRDGWGPYFNIHSYQLKCKDFQLNCEGSHPSFTNLVRVSLTKAPPYIQKREC